jgi:Xaa-Pro dipeptidase
VSDVDSERSERERIPGGYEPSEPAVTVRPDVASLHPFTDDEIAARISATRLVMRERGLAGLCLVSPENVYYLTGLNHQGYFAFTLLVLPLEGEPRLVTRAMERPTVAAQVRGCVHVTFADDEDPADAAVLAIRQVVAGPSRVGMEQASMYLPVSIWGRMRERLADLVWIDESGLVEAVRAVKSRAEVERIRCAAGISDRAIRAGITAVRSGVSEREVAAAVYRELVLGGSEPPGFAPLIRSRDILLHEHVTWQNHLLGHGDALFMELSASVGRYHAPLSRMVYVGKAPLGPERAAEIASHGLQAVGTALRPGAVTGEVYAAWQRVVDEGLGHARYRRHHCGYAVGIGFPPSWVGGSAVVGIRRSGNLVIREGMVFHVLSWILGQEPADYVLSDTVLVRGTGGELLTSTSRDPLVIS